MPVLDTDAAVTTCGLRTFLARTCLPTTEKRTFTDARRPEIPITLSTVTAVFRDDIVATAFV